MAMLSPMSFSGGQRLFCKGLVIYIYIWRHLEWSQSGPRTSYGRGVCLNFNYNNTVMINKSPLFNCFLLVFFEKGFQWNGSPRKIVKDRNRIVIVKKRKDSSLSIISSEGFMLPSVLILYQVFCLFRLFQHLFMNTQN